MGLDVRRILVPVDFSTNAEAVVEWAAELAADHGARLFLLHAYQVPVEIQQFEGGYLPPDYAVEVKRDAEEQLARFAQPARERGLEVEAIVREGSAIYVIEAEAERVSADLIVMGSDEHGTLHHLLMGSKAERIIHRAHCPVLTVKPPRAH